MAQIATPPAHSHGRLHRRHTEGLSAGDRQFRRRVLWTIGAIAASAIVCAGIWVARRPVLLLYISVIASVGLTPAIDRIERWLARTGIHVPRWVAVAIFYLVAITIIGLVGRLLWPRLTDQIGQMRSSLPGAVASFQALLVRHGWMHQPMTFADLMGSSTGALTRPVAIAAGAVTRVAQALADLAIVLVLTFYLLVDGRRVFVYVTTFVPHAQRPTVIAVSIDVATRVSAWLQGIAILAGISAMAMGVVLALIGEPFFYVVALVAGIGEAVPIAGPLLAGGLATAVASAQSLKLAGLVALAFLLLHEVESNILVPRVMSRQVGVSSLAILFGLLVGGEWWGFAGVCLAIPTTAIIVAVLGEVRAALPRRERMAARDRAAASAADGASGHRG